MYSQPRRTKLAAKKNRILNQVFRNGGGSRLELAWRLNMNAAMVGTYVAEFIEDGLFMEGEASPTRRGRSPERILKQNCPRTTNRHSQHERLGELPSKRFDHA